MSHELFDRHRRTLDGAVSALRQRTCFSAYPEVPSGKIYGPTAKEDGHQAFQARLNAPFELDQPGRPGAVGDEVSPYGMKLGVKYPAVELDDLVAAARESTPAWRDAAVEARVGVCLEILDRLNKRSFELANAVMHTTGQGFMMAFQAGGPHAQDRGLEAVAYAYDEMMRCPPHATWKKQVGKSEFVTLEKTFHIVPRGVAALVGCSTFPTWNGYPGLFASLATGNAVVVKPHPGAILPLAITVEVARGVLRDSGFDANLVTLAADTVEAPITEALVTHSGIAIVDYTGGSAFGRWIEAHATQAVVFTETAGVNGIVVDSVDDLKAVAANIAFSICLYSGQMCTTPKNVLIPAAGIRAGGEMIPFDTVRDAIVSAVDRLLGDAGRAAEILGAIQNEQTLTRLDAAVRDGGEVVREAATVTHERFPDARLRSPVILKAAASDKKLYMREVFGPILYLVATEGTDQSLALATETARTQGAITAAVYSTDSSVRAKADRLLTGVGAAVSHNLTGQIFVNQSAAFSDFHVSGLNPAGNATLCDGAFVSNRFRVVQTRAVVNAAG